MFEYPIPRLFVVLQKPKRHRDMIAKPFKKQFRLFFLCECGEHTLREGSERRSHEIHLAKHEGYDIDQPTEFFKKYGPYVITIMTALKYVVASAGFVIPTLGHYVSGIESIQKSLSIAAHEVRPLMDDTIRHIRREMGGLSSGIDTGSGQAELEDLEVLEGADLRLLDSFLQIKDQSRALGNLYRIVTLTGHVKWVCIDHYRENYRQKAHRIFEELVEANGFFYSQNCDTVGIPLRSINLAKQFYQVLDKARGVRSIVTRLLWDVTMDDLRRLATAMTNANIAHLILVGSEESKGSTLDTINSSRRYNPILELITNARIKSLRLSGFRNFYRHINNSSLVATRCLEYLHIDSAFSLSDKRSISALFVILKLCSGLKSLIISLDNCLSTAIVFFKDWTPPHPSSLAIYLKLSRDSAKVFYIQGVFEGVELQVCSVDGLPHDLESILRGHIWRLDLDVTPLNIQGSQLLDIIQHNPILSKLAIKQGPTDNFSIIDSIISTRRKVLSAGGVSVLTGAALTFICPASSQSISTISLNFKANELKPTLSTEVIIHDSTSNDFRGHITALILQYGWSVTKITVGTEFNEDLAAILDRMTEDKGSNLRELTSTLSSLTSSTYDSLFRILERSKQLEGLVVEGSTSVPTSISRYARFNTSLTFSGEDVDKQIAAFSKQGVSRHDLPALKALSVNGSGSMDLSQEHVAWIAEMVSPPHQDTARRSARGPLKSLTSVACTNIRLQPQDWKILIATLDLHSLSKLDLSHTNFALEQLTEMVDLVRSGPYEIDRLSILLSSTKLNINADTREQCIRVEKKLPHAKLVIKNY